MEMHSNVEIILDHSFLCHYSLVEATSSWTDHHPLIKSNKKEKIELLSSSEEEIQPLQKSKPGGLLVLISIILFNIVSISFKNLRQMFTNKIKRY